MKAFVLDCSATLPWAFADEATAPCDALLDSLVEGSSAWVPALWHLEVGNALISAMRRKRIDQVGIENFLSRLGELNIVTDSEDHQHAWKKTLALAIQYKLSLYDATYIELALRRSLPLATLDINLSLAAKKCGITLLL